MLNTINQIRQAFGLGIVETLIGDKPVSNQELVQDTLSFGSKIHFSVGTNFIEVMGKTLPPGQYPHDIVGTLGNMGFIAWKNGEYITLHTPNDIAEFLGRGD